MCLECSWNDMGVCTYRHSDAQVSRDQRVRVKRGRRFYLGDCYESLIFRGGGCRAVVMAHQALVVTKSWEV